MLRCYVHVFILLVFHYLSEKRELNQSILLIITILMINNYQVFCTMHVKTCILYYWSRQSVLHVLCRRSFNRCCNTRIESIVSARSCLFHGLILIVSWSSDLDWSWFAGANVLNKQASPLVDCKVVECHIAFLNYVLDNRVISVFVCALFCR